MSDTTRAPCPWRILEDFGGAFAMGLIGSGIFQFGKGAWVGASGRRLFTGFSRMRTHAPVRGGQFAAWGGLYAVFDCSLLYLRKREDSWNSILSGGLAGGALAVRRGYAAIGTNFIFGALILAMIEGVSLSIQKYQAKMYQPVRPAIPEESASSSASKQ